MSSLLKRCWSSRRRVAESLLVWSGLGRAYEKIAHPTGAVILMYHSVARDDVAPFIDAPNHLSADLFEQQMLFLKLHRRVVAFSDLVASLEAGETPAAGTVCITFDDGYLDNLTVAAPILAGCYLPATVFLATGYMDHAEPQWADRLHCSLMRRTADRLKIPRLSIDLEIGQRAQRELATQILHQCLLQALPDEREATLLEVERQMRPSLGQVPRLGMNWDDVRSMRDRYPLMEIGGHTHRHTDLATHAGDIAQREIASCAADVRRELGVDPRFFSFPYSRSTAQTRPIVKQLGWSAAVGTNEISRVGPDSDRFNLPRIDTPRSMTELRLKTSGAYPGAMVLFGK